MNQETQVTINNSRQIIEPNIHDADISKIEIFDDLVTFTFKTVDQKFCRINFSGGVFFRCDNLMQSNIILDITVSSGEEIEMGDICYLYDEDFNELDSKRQDHYINLLSEFKNEGLKIIYINPSYGCEVIMKCKNVTFSYEK